MNLNPEVRAVSAPEKLKSESNFLFQNVSSSPRREKNCTKEERLKSAFIYEVIPAELALLVEERLRRSRTGMIGNKLSIKTSIGMLAIDGIVQG